MEANVGVGNGLHSPLMIALFDRIFVGIINQTAGEYYSCPASTLLLPLLALLLLLPLHLLDLE